MSHKKRHVPYKYKIDKYSIALLHVCSFNKNNNKKKSRSILIMAIKNIRQISATFKERFRRLSNSTESRDQKGRKHPRFLSYSGG